MRQVPPGTSSRCSRSTGPPPSAPSSACSTRSRSSGWIASSQTAAGSTPSAGSWPSTRTRCPSPATTRRPPSSSRSRQKTCSATDSIRRSSESLEARRSSCDPRSSCSRTRPASACAAVVAATSASSMRSAAPFAVSIEPPIRYPTQLTAGAQWNADDRRDPLLRPEHQLVCETLGLGAEAPRVEAQRPVGAPAPDDARNEPPVLHERDLDEIESERVPHAPRQQLDDRERLVARGDRAHRPQEPQTARSAQVSAGRQPLERVLDRAGGALDDRAAVALGEALARLDADDSRHVRVEARSCQRLDPPDHLDVAGIRADRPLHRDRPVALVGACEQPGAQRVRVDHLVVAALSRQPEAILVLHVHAREKRFADLRAQRRAHRGVGLVGARHPHERAREGAVEAFDIKAHLLQIGQIAPGFTWNCVQHP